MFLTKDNHIKWRALGIGAALTAVLCLMGVMWGDRQIFLYLRNFDCMLFRAFGHIFQAKAWLVVTAILMVMFYIKKTINTESYFIENIKNFKFGLILSNFLEKTKNSYAFFMFCSILSACVVTGIIKVVLGRARPILYEGLGQTGFFPFSGDWVFHSMPSGHTTASFAALVMMGLLAPRMKWATWTLAVMIGVSRVCVGAHWPSDVILGAFIGMAAADLVKSGLIRRLGRFGD